MPALKVRIDNPYITGYFVIENTPTISPALPQLTCKCYFNINTGITPIAQLNKEIRNDGSLELRNDLGTELRN